MDKHPTYPVALLCKGLIIPGHILLSDKTRGKCDQNTRGSSAPEGILVTFSLGFWSDINIWPGIIHSDYNISVYNNIFNYLLWNILILPKQILAFPHIRQSRWKDKVTATKIRVFDTHEDPHERVFMSGLIMLISIVFSVLSEMIMTYLSIIIFSIIYCRTFLFYFQNFWLSCILDNLGGRIK